MRMIWILMYKRVITITALINLNNSKVSIIKPKILETMLKITKFLCKLIKAWICPWLPGCHIRQFSWDHRSTNITSFLIKRIWIQEELSLQESTLPISRDNNTVLKNKIHKIMVTNHEIFFNVVYFLNQNLKIKY